MGERIVVGLGNPGPTYARTRHNAGFMVIERLAQRWAIALTSEERGLVVGRGPVAGIPVRLVEPQRFMNVSGPAMQQLHGEWQVNDMVVVYDDVDLPAGRLRIRHGGGTAGHRGIASLVETFGPEFDRVRVGVGRPPGSDDTAEYVLQPLADAALQSMLDTVDRATDAIECLLTEGLERAMNRFNVRQSDVAEDATQEAARRSPCGVTRH